MLKTNKLFKLDMRQLAQWLFMAEAVTMLFSTALSNVCEILLLGVFIGTPSLRSSFVHAVKHPIVMAILVFYGWIVIASAYGIETFDHSLSAIAGWRKILLLPFAVVLFDADWLKHKFIRVLMYAVSIMALLSFASHIFGFQIRDSYALGIIIRNHATQGILFSVMAFTIAILLMTIPAKFNASEKTSMLMMMLLFILNIVYITPGRSGYLALIVLSVVAVIAYFILKKKVLIPILALVLVPLALLSSPTVNQRISQGVNEASAYQSDNQFSSMGIRMVLWKNTLKLIQKKPILGYGTGAFEKAYLPTLAGKPDWQHVITHDPHNQYMKIATEQGLIGLAIFAWFLIACFKAKVPLHYRILALGVLLVWCGNSLFSSHFSTFVEGRFIYIWLGVLLASTTGTTDNAVRKA